MGSVFDDQSIEVPCPGCGRKHAKSAKWIKTNDLIHCECESTIRLNKRQFIDAVRRAEAAIANFPREIRIKF